MFLVICFVCIVYIPCLDGVWRNVYDMRDLHNILSNQIIPSGT